MRKISIILVSSLMMVLLASLSSAQAAQIVPYSNTTHLGYKMFNISTDSVTTLIIGNHTLKFTQNYITPSGAGATINNVSYNLTLGQPAAIQGQNGVYLELTRVNYIPRLHTVDLDIYQNVTTTTTIITTTTTILTISSTTITIAPTTIQPTVSVLPTITIPQTTNSTINSLINRIIAAIKSLLSKL